ncbi:MAG: hypothetical protein ACK54H_04865 [Phycisphaerales bacterium]|jgi:hypothetical protein
MTDIAETPVVQVSASNVNRRWTLTQIMYIVVLEAFAALCIYDALWKYPARGADAAAFNEYRYLNALAKSDATTLAGFNLKDPVSAFERLAKKADLIGTDQALNEWLTQLSYIGALDGANTSFPRTDFRKGGAISDPNSRLAELKTEWERSDGSDKSHANPLTSWDIPSQWIMLVMCELLSIGMAVVLIRTKSRHYGWDAATMTLTLPDGNSITPADLEDVDKRKWHKFYVHLRIKSAHPKLGGKEIEFDLKRYDHLEGWILAMESKAFPERAAAEVAKS